MKVKRFMKPTKRIILIYTLCIILIYVAFTLIRLPCLLAPSVSVSHGDYATNFRTDCFQDWARNTKDVSQCEYVKDYPYTIDYDSCVRSVAEEAQNADWCNKIITKSNDWRENCIIAVAVKKK